MNSPHITYVASGGDANPQTELSALANIYKFIIDRREKRAAPESRPDDARKDQE